MIFKGPLYDSMLDFPWPSTPVEQRLVICFILIEEPRKRFVEERGSEPKAFPSRKGCVLLPQKGWNSPREVTSASPCLAVDREGTPGASRAPHVRPCSPRCCSHTHPHPPSSSPNTYTRARHLATTITSKR